MKNKQYRFAPPKGAIAECDAVTEVAVAQPKQATGCVREINVRIKAYHREKISREIMHCIDEDPDIDALRMDHDKGSIANMIKVTDEGALLTSATELKEARAYFQRKGRTPGAWAPYVSLGDYPPFLFKMASFINYFGKNILVLLDIFRPPWKPYIR